MGRAGNGLGQHRIVPSRGEAGYRRRHTSGVDPQGDPGRIVITDRNALRPVRVGLELASALLRLFPGKFDVDAAARLFGSTVGLGQIKVGDDPATIAGGWRANEARWRQLRAKYLLYR